MKRLLGLALVLLSIRSAGADLMFDEYLLTKRAGSTLVEVLPSASVRVYNLGASVRTSSGSPSTTIPVYASATIHVSDTVKINGYSATVTAVPTATTITVSPALVYVKGARVLRTSSALTVYEDVGRTVVLTQPFQADSSGRVTFFPGTATFDLEAITTAGQRVVRYWPFNTTSPILEAATYATSGTGAPGTGGDCATGDPYLGWESALTTLPAAGLAVHFSPGCYGLAAPLNLYERTTLYGDGPTSVIVATANMTQTGGITDGVIRSANSCSTVGCSGSPLYNMAAPGAYNVIRDLKVDMGGKYAYSAIQLDGITDVQIRNLVVDGRSTDMSSAGGFGIEIDRANKVTVTGNHVTGFVDGVNGNCITVGGSSTVQGRALVVNDNLVEKCGAYGLDLQYVDGGVITGNVVKGAQYGIAMETVVPGASAAAKNVTISGNTIQGTTDLTKQAAIPSFDGRTMNRYGIVLWLRPSADTVVASTQNYNVNVTGNTIRDVGAAITTNSGHVSITNNNIWNWGNSVGGPWSAIDLATALTSTPSGKTGDLYVAGNYIHQEATILASNAGTVGAIRIDNGGGRCDVTTGTKCSADATCAGLGGGNVSCVTLGPIDNVTIENNVIEGMATNPRNGANTLDIVEHGIYIASPGNNWKITGNTFRGVTDEPIRMISNAPTTTFTNWDVSRNTFYDNNIRTGKSASAWIYFQDAQGSTYTKFVFEGNHAFDANSNLTYLVHLVSGTWTAGVYLKDNIAPNATSGIWTTPSTADNVTSGVDDGNIGIDTYTTQAASGSSYQITTRKGSLVNLTSTSTTTAFTLEAPGLSQDGKLFTVCHESGEYASQTAVMAPASGTTRLRGPWMPQSSHDCLMVIAFDGLWYEIGRSDQNFGTRRSFQSGITASTTQTQGQGALQYEVSEISTVANAGDTVTLPTAWAGKSASVINDGANNLQVFPAAGISGDNIGNGSGASTTIAPAAVLDCYAYDSNNWRCTTGRLQSKTVGLSLPTTSEDVTIWRTPNAIRVRRMDCVITSGAALTYTLRWDPSRSATGTEFVSSGTLCNNLTVGVANTGLSIAIPAGSWIWLETTATGASGTVNNLSTTFQYTEP